KALPLSYGSSSIPGFDLDKGLDYLAGSHPIAGDRKLVALDAGASEFGHLWGVGGSVFFSPRHQLLYVTHSTGWGETWLDVLHPQTMDYLDSIAVKASLHDPQNGRFYALGWQEPHITVFDEPTVSLDAREAMIAPSGSLPVDLDSLVLSPAFTGDRTLFATSGASLFTSSDAGETWSEITLPFLVRGTMGVALSPDYALGRTILVGMACTPSGNGILRSTDGGRNWSRVNSGLTDLGIEALLFSPDYAHDGTVFADGCFDGAFKSTDGGTTWRPLKIDLPTGEWSGKPLGQLMMSPAYPPDGQLWFLTPSRVLRSLDAGETWERADIGLEGLELDRLVLSPNYQVDSTALVTIGRGIYITRNGGEAWQVMPLPSPELWVTDLALSPDFVTDHVLFVAGFDKDYADRLYRSSDAGRTWLSVGEEFAGDSFVALTLSPLYSEDGLVFVSTDRGVYRSADGGEKWKLLNLPGARFLVFSPSFSSDHTIYASSQQGLYRSQDSGENWSGLQQSAEPVPTPVPAPEASPAPIPRATSIACPALDPVFQSVADRVESLRLSSGALPNVGCPTGPAQTVSSAWQIFLAQAPGSDASAAAAYLIWRSDRRTVYVIPPADSTTGRSEAAVYEDTWSEGMPEIPPSCAGLTPPTGLQIPIRGFGKVWCEHGLYDDIGFAYGLEKGGDFLIQEAERGLYISVPEVGSFVIDIVNGLALSQ
ncbi:MAG: hypothetical protein OEV76_11525, partial [Anaerolineae bacterium]|nr:hypothetical protein [Anaerolineae bacterium]